MEAVLDTGVRFTVDDLLNFTLDVGEEDDDSEKTQKAPSSSSLESSDLNSQVPDDHQSLPLPEFAEEELEWLSNKDAFPAVETCLEILSDNTGIVLNHQSPVSVLESSTTTTTSNSSSTTTTTTTTTTSCCGGRIQVPVRYPVKARSTRQRRRRCGFPDLPGQQCWSWNQSNLKNSKQEFRAPAQPNAGTIGRRCQHCLAEKTPQWRAGPMGPKTLCNACGVRYKSGRLVPEYRPASSPTFSSVLHSNSHRKVVEMRKQKQLGGTALKVDIG